MSFLERELSSFNIASQEFIYESLEPATKASEQFKKIYTLLGITECIRKKMYLNLEILELDLDAPKKALAN